MKLKDGIGDMDLKIIPHFELTATDYGYSSLQEAYEVNRDFYNKVGGEAGIPVADINNNNNSDSDSNSSNSGTGTKKTITVNGKTFDVEVREASKEERQSIIDYIKRVQEGQ